MKAAAQILQKTEDLKQKLSVDVLNDNEAWNNHQQLQDLYQQLLVTDLEYSLDKKVEQDLWNYGFKNQINLLQMKAKDRKNPQRNDCQESLGWFLENASGFYLQLLQELCEAFDLDIPCRRKNAVYGLMRVHSHNSNEVKQPMKTSCLYICQHCLVHLGDIARYRNHALQAETFYKHAADLVPSNGQPYNQLALLEAAKGDKLCTVFYYVRSIAVKCPFPVSSTNLQKMFSKMANDDFQYEGKSKLSVYDYIVAFLHFHSLLHLTTGLDKAEKLLKVLSSNLTVLIATESLSAWKLIQMAAINIFAASNASRSLDSVEVEQELLTEDEQTAYNLVVELIASTLNGLLLLVYTLKEDLKSYYVLPVIKLMMNWLSQDLNHLKASAFASRLQIWPSFCKLLNSLQATKLHGFDHNKYAHVPLPEDWDLQCFLPLQKAYKSYKWQQQSPLLSSEEEHSLRVYRLLEIGRWMCEQEIYGLEVMRAQTESEDGMVQFEAVSSQLPSCETLKQLKEITCRRSPEENKVDQRHVDGQMPNLVNYGGIGIRTPNSSLKERKSRPNVALQTIMQKNSPTDKNQNSEEPLAILKLKSEIKQVTFKTPSPSPPASSSGTPPLLSYAVSSTPSPVFHLENNHQLSKKNVFISGQHHAQETVNADYNGYPGMLRSEGGTFNHSFFSCEVTGGFNHPVEIDGANQKLMLGGNLFGYNLDQPRTQQQMIQPPIGHTRAHAVGQPQPPNPLTRLQCPLETLFSHQLNLGPGSCNNRPPYHIHNFSAIQRPHFGPYQAPQETAKIVSYDNTSSANTTQNTYSLFNSSWSSGINAAIKENDGVGTGLNHSPVLNHLFQSNLQSLWSGPGPSPLERLLEQQKQKETAPH
ncbi:hypothetical protein CHUAL_009519 [Chamberlinius hualienensis]